ncbi:MAG: response regulator [Bacteroides sp.]|nr:response regulator [Bacteroides sp.]
MIVDDQEINRMILAEGFADGGYQIEEAENGREALKLIEKFGENIVAIILDLMMPVMDGYELLQYMNDNRMISSFPVFVITGENEKEALKKAYNLGAVDVIRKPFLLEFIKKRIGNVIELYRMREQLLVIVEEQELRLDEQAKQLREQTNKLMTVNSSIIEMLATTIEFRDCESGEHVRRIRTMTLLMIRHYIGKHPDCGISNDQLSLIADAAVLHDIGKIAIPDNILCKPGRLTNEEFAIMKEHTTRGCEILEQIPHLLDSNLYRYCYDICRHHHERWDGRGYPDGLKGDEISIWAQVVSLADVYDALVSERVYKAAFSHEKAVEMILNGECGAFNPDILVCFHEIEAEVKRFYSNGAESEKALEGTY